MRSTTGLGVRRLGVTVLLLSLSAFSATAWADIRLTPSSVSVSVGATAISTVSGTRDPLTVRSANSGIATASIAGNVISVRGVAAGSSIVVVLHGGERVATLGVTVTRATTLRVTPTSLSISVGSRATAGVSGAAGSVSVRSLNTAIASASISGTTISVLGVAPGSTSVQVSDSRGSVTLAVTVTSTAPQLQVTPPALSVAIGGSATATASGAVGALSVTSLNTAVATVSISGTVLTVRGVAAGNTSVQVSDTLRSVTLAVSVTSTVPVTNNGIPVSGPGTGYAILAANDLGMHCADLDYQIFSILPPFNNMHSQVIRKGTTPVLVDSTAADVYYAATSNANDPAGANSITTTCANSSAVFKTNFWQRSGTQTLGSLIYRVLYPVQSCGAASCPSVLDLFAPIQQDVGLPAPDPNSLPALVAHQQAMMSVVSVSPYVAAPYQTNSAQKVLRYDTNLAFFSNFPFGGTMLGVNWFSADAIPIVPVDDLGRENPYPLARVAAVSKGGSPYVAGNILAAVDVPLSVAAEADCQGCHAARSDAALSSTPLNGLAADFATTKAYSNGTPWHIATATDSDVPGPEYLFNAAKLNILRLHDAKHGAHYIASDTGAADPCSAGTEAGCLATRRSITCSQCHYSPALDLAQVGPIDEPAAGRFGRQQTSHISMSSAMHGFHGRLKTAAGQYVFPDVPAADVAGRAVNAPQLLEQTCYQCHPGKRTKCLRGAMTANGVMCQDCHGNLRQLGNDFTSTFATAHGSLDLSKRVPWANEPKCQSCHIGDAVTVQAINRTDMIVAADGIHLLQAFTRTAAAQPVLLNIQSPSSRFAENNVLYRLSKGHGGVMCEGCHGSTHAIYPNGIVTANDNVPSTQLQGHSGTVIECTVCHTAGSIGRNLNGPHGMHVVNDSGFTNGGHGGLAEGNAASCRACHGQNGQGTVLSRVAANRTLNGHALTAGTAVTCNLCHSSPL